jgi:regulator of protease activity HflC (stomatin/prohibitin superfamily)
MNWLQQLADWIKGLKCWYIVQPWEAAIRVRAGKWVVAIGPGLHLRIPFFDQVFIQNVRQRVLNLPVQTVTTRAGETITLSGVVNWRIADVARIYEKLQAPEDWIYNQVLAAIAEAVFESSGEVIPKEVGEKAQTMLVAGRDAQMGIEIVSVSVTDIARVRTYRLITGEGNTGWSWDRVGGLNQPTVR